MNAEIRRYTRTYLKGRIGVCTSAYDAHTQNCALMCDTRHPPACSGPPLGAPSLSTSHAPRPRNAALGAPSAASEIESPPPRWARCAPAWSANGSVTHPPESRRGDVEPGRYHPESRREPNPEANPELAADGLLAPNGVPLVLARSARFVATAAAAATATPIHRGSQTLATRGTTRLRSRRISRRISRHIPRRHVERLDRTVAAHVRRPASSAHSRDMSRDRSR